MQNFTLAALTVIALASVTACKKSDDVPPTVATPATPGAPASGAASQPASTEPAPVPPRVEGPVGDLLEAYEGARAKLAADDLAGAQPFAAQIAGASTTASEHSVTIKQTYLDIVAAANKMSAAKDIGEARLAFGDVSKNLISILVADPELRTGRFLFECPMAKGYQRWVQIHSKLNNPYWGKEMLECGSELKTWGV